MPEHLVGRLASSALVTDAGTEEPGTRTRGAADPELSPDGQMLAELPYAQLQSMLDDPPGFRNYWSAEYLGAMPDLALDLFCARAPDMVIPSRVAAHPVPAGRSGRARPRRLPDPVAPGPVGGAPAGHLGRRRPTTSAARQWAKNTVADMEPWSIGAVYLNFIGSEGDQRVKAGLGPENQRRLAVVKTQYDPDNTFHLNQNIRPA